MRAQARDPSDPWTLASVMASRARRLVEHQHCGLADQCAGERDALALAARKQPAAVGDHGVVLHWYGEDLVVNERLSRGLDDGFERKVGIAERNISVDRTAEQVRMLRHHATCRRSERNVRRLVSMPS